MANCSADSRAYFSGETFARSSGDNPRSQMKISSQAVSRSARADAVAERCRCCLAWFRERLFMIGALPHEGEQGPEFALHALHPGGDIAARELGLGPGEAGDRHGRGDIEAHNIDQAAMLALEIAP